MDVPVRRVMTLGAAAFLIGSSAAAAQSPTPGAADAAAVPTVTATAMTPALYDDDDGGNLRWAHE